MQSRTLLVGIHREIGEKMREIGAVDCGEGFVQLINKLLRQKIKKALTGASAWHWRPSPGRSSTPYSILTIKMPQGELESACNSPLKVRVEYQSFKGRIQRKSHWIGPSSRATKITSASRVHPWHDLIQLCVSVASFNDEVCFVQLKPVDAV
jgi:hypothetical protein